MSKRIEPRPLFSVVIPTFDRARYLSEAIDSVLHQTLEDVECIVVDDAGPTPARVPDDPRVRLIRLDHNVGAAEARNIGVAAARGRYLAFLDDDDVFTPARLELALDGLERAPLALCGRGDLWGIPATNRDLEGDVRDVILDTFTPSLGQVALSRANFIPFDKRLRALEDVDWWLRVTHVHPVTSSRTLGYLVRAHDGPRVGNDDGARLHASRMFIHEYAGYFANHRRAAAFRWHRISQMEFHRGNIRAGFHAFAVGWLKRPTLRPFGYLGRATLGLLRRWPPTTATN